MIEREKRKVGPFLWVSFVGVFRLFEVSFGILRIRPQVHGCLDPLTRSLVTFEDEEDLVSKIEEIYMKLDMDDSGGKQWRERGGGREVEGERWR
jgi:hypothetical protein